MGIASRVARSISRSFAAAGGLLSAGVVPMAALLAVAILAGNRLGDFLRRFIRPEMAVRIESGTLLCCVVLSLLGLR